MRAEWPSQLACHRDAAQFANGFTVAQPMELHFVMCRTVTAVQPTDSGSPVAILSLTPLELSFEDEGYKAAHHLDRIDVTLTQRVNLVGAFFGNCDVRPLVTRTTKTEGTGLHSAPTSARSRKGRAHRRPCTSPGTR
jgi:hypothetical protein